MSGVKPFFNLLLGGGGFLPVSFFGLYFFFLVGVGGASSSASDRLGTPAFAVLLPFSVKFLFRPVWRPEKPIHRSICCANLPTTKYRGQFWHLTVGNDTFSGAPCLKELSGVVGGLEPGVS